jgi:hypothetical protein
VTFRLVLLILGDFRLVIQNEISDSGFREVSRRHESAGLQNQDAHAWVAAEWR